MIEKIKLVWKFITSFGSVDAYSKLKDLQDENAKLRTENLLLTEKAKNF
jgi:hypothetical protein